MFQPAASPDNTIRNSEFNLDVLKEFNPALIYGFDVEASVEKTDPGSVNYLFHGCGQHEDMFNAYLYAQECILPAIEKIGIANITPQQLWEWLDQIHLRIAHTLSEDVKKLAVTSVQAGKPAEVPIYRWHAGASFGNYLVRYLAGKVSTSQFLAFAKNLNLERNIVTQFINFMVKIRDDKSTDLPGDQEVITKNDNGQYILKGNILHKLRRLYEENKLTAKEKKLVDQFVKFCPHPKNIPRLCQEFAEKFLPLWRDCNPNDINQVASVIHTAFYGLTEIHRYFNANGRTATCFSNVVLRSLKKRSILMRNPNERNDPNSSYTKAIANIDTNPTLLLAHIRERIIAAENGQFYADKELAEHITTRMQLYYILKKIKLEFPTTPFEQHYHQICNKILLQIPKNHTIPMLTAACKSILTSLLTYYATLKTPVASSQTTTSLLDMQKQSTPQAPVASSVIQRVYTPQEIQNIVKKLEDLTQQQGWKVVNNNGLKIYLTTTNMDIATTVLQQLIATNAIQARLVAPDRPIISLEAISPEKLLAVSVSSGTTNISVADLPPLNV